MPEFVQTADASIFYRETTAAPLARSVSSSDVGNLAAITRNSSFVWSAPAPSEVALPREVAPVTPGRR